MDPSTIATTLLAAAAFLKKPIAEVSAQAIQDSYGGVKTYLLRKLGAESSAGKALEMATDKPESTARKSLLMEELESSDIGTDSQFASLIEQLRLHIEACAPAVCQPVRVVGNDNVVQIAGRDLITTRKHVQRNVITPDERHLSREQGESLRRMIGQAARRFTDNGAPNFAVVHCMLQRRYSVASYLLIPREQFDDALNFLIQRRAIYRSRARRSDLSVYRKDLFRSIFAAADKLEWNQSQVCEYAAKVLGTEKPIILLKELGPLQLKRVEGSIKREVARRKEPK